MRADVDGDHAVTIPDMTVLPSTSSNPSRPPPTRHPLCALAMLYRTPQISGHPVPGEAPLPCTPCTSWKGAGGEVRVRPQISSLAQLDDPDSLPPSVQSVKSVFRLVCARARKPPAWLNSTTLIPSPHLCNP
jgi:hypothetical protein